MDDDHSSLRVVKLFAKSNLHWENDPKFPATGGIFVVR